jgi:hypothetical protein
VSHDDIEIVRDSNYNGLNDYYAKAKPVYPSVTEPTSIAVLPYNSDEEMDLGLEHVQMQKKKQKKRKNAQQGQVVRIGSKERGRRPNGSRKAKTLSSTGTTEPGSGSTYPSSNVNDMYQSPSKKVIRESVGPAGLDDGIMFPSYGYEVNPDAVSQYEQSRYATSTRSASSNMSRATDRYLREHEPCQQRAAHARAGERYEIHAETDKRGNSRRGPKAIEDKQR